MGRRPRRARRRVPGRGGWVAASPDQGHSGPRTGHPGRRHPGRRRRQRPRPRNARGRGTRPSSRHLLRPHGHRSGPEHNPNSIRPRPLARLSRQGAAKRQDRRPHNRRSTGTQYVRRLRHHPRVVAPQRQERCAGVSPGRVTGPGLDPIDFSRGALPSRATGSDGRFAPSPTGALHLGNLRTALLAWLFARSAGSRFLMRIEDLDAGRVRPGLAEAQLADLAAIGLDWDPPVMTQSARLEAYAAAIARLDADGALYPCYCTRREIREAASAPHGPLPEGAYPGTCRELTDAQRGERERSGRPPALRLRAGGERVGYTDRLLGPLDAIVDDVVVRRNDGAPAYNLAVVV